MQGKGKNSRKKKRAERIEGDSGPGVQHNEKRASNLKGEKQTRTESGVEV